MFVAHTVIGLNMEHFVTEGHFDLWAYITSSEYNAHYFKLF